MFKEVIVVMLPTNKKSIKKDLVISPMGLGIHISNIEPSYHNSQHLYVLSTDVIKKLDWYIDLHNLDKPKQCDSNELANNLNLKKEQAKKIIATTNKSLNISEYAPQLWKYLPNLPQSFIKEYIEKYNEGKVITTALVEYENVPCDEVMGEYITRLKTIAKDTIILKTF